MAPNRKEIEKLGDEALLAQYRLRKDPMYIGELFRRYADIVFLVCMKYFKDEAKSQDAMMHIFEKLLSNISRYEIKSFRYWLHTVSKNYCLAELDKLSISRQKIEQYVHLGQEVDENKYLELLSQEEKENLYLELEQALGSLGNEQRICVSGFYLEDKSYQHIANETGYTLNQVKSYIQNGKRNLKNILEKKAWYEKSKE